VISSAAQANQLDDLINTSAALVGQIDRGVKFTGTAIGFANSGTGLSDGSLSSTAHISDLQLQAYNQALTNLGSYQPYGSVETRLQDAATNELDLMDQAVETFTAVVADMVTVVEVSEMASTATSPADQEALQEYVVTNSEALQITQQDVDTYNQSLDDIETHANTASAFIAVAANSDALDFLQTGLETANTTADNSSLQYDAAQQWVYMGYDTTNSASAVFLNGQDAFGINLYATEADILTIGAQSEYYLNGPTSDSYRCFMTEENC